MKEQFFAAQFIIAWVLVALVSHEVAWQLMDHDAIGAHARDELGITEFASAKPLIAAVASAIAFAAGAALPLLTGRRLERLAVFSRGKVVRRPGVRLDDSALSTSFRPVDSPGLGARVASYARPKSPAPQ